MPNNDVLEIEVLELQQELKKYKELIQSVKKLVDTANTSNFNYENYELLSSIKSNNLIIMAKYP